MSIINTEFAIDMILHSMILFTFLSVLYIMYISKLSKKIFDNEISKNIDKLAKNLTKNDNTKKYLQNIPYDSLISMFEEESDYLTIQNDWLFGTIKYGLIAMWIIFIGFIFMLKNNCSTEINITEMIKNNAVTFLLIGIFEYMFFTNIAIKFVPIEPSVLTNTFFSDLNKIF